MAGLLVELSDPAGGTSCTVDVESGQEVTFGSGSVGEPVDILLDDSATEPLAGRIRATADYWLVTNLSQVFSYVVQNDDDQGEYVRVPPRRLNMPIPFTRARLALPSAGGLSSLTVTAQPPAYVGEPAGPDDQKPAAFSLDERAKYFLVLVALCEPRLRGASTPTIPSTPEIVRRLRKQRTWRGITGAAVNFHIDYLARRKLRVRDEEIPGTGVRVNWQREAVVSTALRFGLVTKEHLALLGPC
ncbi:MULTISPECIES: serine/threonine protein kinase [unclassified Streptomyces]|uniref:serine/threonine protein kinase n=1 Tax=unclassified Streptomyces TaxID=2593676 RepID=UPI0033201B12